MSSLITKTESEFGHEGFAGVYPYVWLQQLLEALGNPWRPPSVLLAHRPGQGLGWKQRPRRWQSLVP